MGYRLNRLDEPVFLVGPKPMQTEFGIHLRLESCDPHLKIYLLNISTLLKVLTVGEEVKQLQKSVPSPTAQECFLMGNPCRMCVCVCILLLVCTVNYPFHKQKGDEFENKPHFSVSAGI